MSFGIYDAHPTLTDEHQIGLQDELLLQAHGDGTDGHAQPKRIGESSLAHGLVMLGQALRDSTERANLFGDVPALLLIGGVLLFLNREKQAPKPAQEGGDA